MNPTNTLPESWCVLNDRSPEFRKVLDYLYKKYAHLTKHPITGKNNYYGERKDVNVWQWDTEPFGTLLTIQEFERMSKPVESEVIKEFSEKQLASEILAEANDLEGNFWDCVHQKSPLKVYQDMLHKLVQEARRFPSTAMNDNPEYLRIYNAIEVLEEMYPELNELKPNKNG